MGCRCDEVAELWDDDAKSYADAHLERVEVRANGWEVLYRCGATGREWLEDYPVAGKMVADRQAAANSISLVVWLSPQLTGGDGTQVILFSAEIAAHSKISAD